jgi:hypothetical protein
MEDPDQLTGFLVDMPAAGRSPKDAYVKFYMAAIKFRPMRREGLAKGETITNSQPISGC